MVEGSCPMIERGRPEEKGFDVSCDRHCLDIRFVTSCVCPPNTLTIHSWDVHTYESCVGTCSHHVTQVHRCLINARLLFTLNFYRIKSVLMTSPSSSTHHCCCLKINQFCFTLFHGKICKSQLYYNISETQILFWETNNNEGLVTFWRTCSCSQSNPSLLPAGQTLLTCHTFTTSSSP